MKRAKKWIGALAAAVVVLVVLVVVLVGLFGNHAVKAGIEKAGRYALKVGVHLDSAALSLFGGTLTLDSLVIDNPEGYQHPTLLTLEQGFVAVDTGSLLSDTVEIEKIQLDNITLTLEQKGLTSNLQEVLNNLPVSDAPSEPDQKPGKNLKIKELHINGVRVNAKLLPLPGRADTVSLRLSPITLRDIGTDEPIDTVQLTGVVLAAIAGGIVEQGKDMLPTDMLNTLGQSAARIGQELLQEGLNIGTKLLEGTGTLGKDILDSAGDIGKDAGEAIRGIFQRKED
ncbi:MAG: AsmA family protein [Planctomycetes bacterium]|nr:AsmA family protein [Planctomycetota bacterium]